MIVITGGTGFIGSYLVREVVNTGEKPTVIDINPPTKLLDSVKNDMNFVRADILDELEIVNLLKDTEIIYHLAAMVGRLQGKENRHETIRVNVNGTLNILEACRKNDIEKMIFASTSEVLGEAIYTPMDENHPKNPITSYGIAKEAAEDLCKLYHRWYGLNVICPRFFNVYGPGETANVYRGVIIRFIWEVLNNRPPIVDKGCQRSFQYITDLTRALLLLEKKGKAGEVYHLCGTESITIEDLADLIIDLCGKSKVISPKFREPGPMDVRIKIPDGQKAKNTLGYVPQISIKEGIKRTIDWARSLI